MGINFKLEFAVKFESLPRNGQTNNVLSLFSIFNNNNNQEQQSFTPDGITGNYIPLITVETNDEGKSKVKVVTQIGENPETEILLDLDLGK